MEDANYQNKQSSEDNLPMLDKFRYHSCKLLKKKKKEVLSYEVVPFCLVFISLGCKLSKKKIQGTTCQIMTSSRTIGANCNTKYNLVIDKYIETKSF